MDDANLDLNVVDKNENSVYHIATMFENGESLRLLLDGHDNDKILSKNDADDTILHCACRIGNVAMVKQILNKLYETNNSLDEFLLAKNKRGDTCFHICCSSGYANIVEYFLREAKLNQLLEVPGHNSNTALHLAVRHGHASIVKCLIEHGAEVNVRNDDHMSPLELSCRKGFYEISKHIILSQTTNTPDSNQLHIACNEGAHEVVRFLLHKGTPIDKLNDENKNCLDIAIDRGHKEVIKVLLNDTNWRKLIRSADNIESDKKLLVKKCKENAQMVAMYEAKMWEMIMIVLDRCVIYDELGNEKAIDFTVLDPPLIDMNRHPLMLIACSGQENLLQHRATRALLHLKWRFMPRLVFYFNIFFYAIFLIFFSIFTVELAELTARFKAQNNSDRVSIDELIGAQGFVFFVQDMPHSPLVIIIAIQVIFQVLMEMFQVFFIDG